MSEFVFHKIETTQFFLYFLWYYFCAFFDGWVPSNLLNVKISVIFVTKFLRSPNNCFHFKNVIVVILKTIITKKDFVIKLERDLIRTSLFFELFFSAKRFWPKFISIKFGRCQYSSFYLQLLRLVLQKRNNYGALPYYTTNDLKKACRVKLTVPDEKHKLYPFSMNLLDADGSQRHPTNGSHA